MKLLFALLIALISTASSRAHAADQPFKFMCQLGDGEPQFLNLSSGESRQLVKDGDLTITLSFQDVVPGFVTMPTIALTVQQGAMKTLTQGYLAPQGSDPGAKVGGSVNIVVQRPQGERRAFCLGAKELPAGQN